MTTRRELHGNISFMERIRLFALRIANNLDKATQQNKPTTMHMTTYKCTSGSNSNIHFVTCNNDDVRSACRGLEILYGRITDIVKQSDTVYKVTFKSDLVFKLSKYP